MVSATVRLLLTGISPQLSPAQPQPHSLFPRGCLYPLPSAKGQSLNICATMKRDLYMRDVLLQLYSCNLY